MEARKEMENMAASGITVDYDKMADSSVQLTQEGETFETTISNMRRIINALPDIWQGDTCDSYVTQFEDLEKSFTETRELIEDLSEQLTSISNAYRETDEAMSKKVGAK